MDHEDGETPAFQTGSDLLVTRIVPPVWRPAIVARPHLDAIFQHGRRGMLTLVVAPAGAGKTTAVGAWLAGARGEAHTVARVPARVAWLSLDPDMDDPARFWAHLAAACDQFASGCATGVQALLQADQPPAPAALVAALSNRLAALPWDGGADRPYVLVLDDYHAIERPEIHAGVSRLLAYLPPQVHMIITTRADPPLPLARLRARRLLTEIRVADLRFGRDEFVAMLNAAGEPPLNAAALDTLMQRTEGWAAGLWLAVLALRNHPDPAGFVAAFAGTHRYLVDYLTDEVLDRQPAYLRRFLLVTSIVDRLCASLCDAVLGMDDATGSGPASQGVSSQSLLEDIERRGLFLMPLDDERRWYRYHQLFADVLRVRLGTLDPGSLPSLHRRASMWYAAAANDDPALLTDAVRHALAAGDADQAADLVERTAARIWSQGELRTILELLRLLPHAIIEARPGLALALARATIGTGNINAVRSLLDAAAARLEDAPNPAEASRLRGWIAVLASHEARLREQPDQVQAHATAALAILPDDDVDGRGLVMLGLAMSQHVAGSLPAAAEHYVEAISLLQAAGNRHDELHASAMLGTVMLMRGDLDGAESLLAAALDRAQVGGATLPVAAMAYNALGEIAYLRCQLDRAQSHCATALALAELGQVGDAILVGHELWVKLDLARGDATAAARRVSALLMHAEMRGITHLMAWAQSVGAWVALAQGRTADAAGWAAKYRPTIGRLSPIRGDAFVTYVRVLLATGRTAEARTLVERQLPHSIAAGYVEQQLQIAILAAIACAEQSDLSAATRHLVAALTCAASQGIRQPFLNAGAPLFALLQRVAPSLDESLHSFARSLTSAPTPVVTPVVTHPRAAGHAPGMVESLTPREREILGLMAAGLSNQEIADMLVIGVGTVKTHLHSLYGKLAARDRMSAVVRARTLGLLA